ncbi:hypothetical protein PM738_04425 [Erysipelatoclostridium ramosum]|uniref:S-layer protein SbsC C-terminal domain-containing protein n=1 Tax=Thomasclavelia ramosa TaxID=1547 RepID=A0AB35IFI2_9FIRM|nr:hypothetical protein [Thomasclavelia ramosa]MDB7083039.1 hypothetical protein [Thomasclavelia ramosa]
MGHESQVRYSKLIDIKLRNELVLKDGVVFNNRYEGDPKAGAVKIPVRDTEVEVNRYDRSKGAGLTESSTTYEDMLINQDEAVNELIDGYTAQTVPDNLVADRLDSAGYSLALSLDSVGMKTLEDNSTEFGGTVALTNDNVYSFFTKARTKHSKLGVPKIGRFAIVTPEIYELLLNEPKFLAADKLNETLIKQGIIGQIAGYNIIECTYGDETTEIIFGHPNWCHRVKDWKVPVAVNDLKGSGNFIGASAVQGRQVYGYKVTKRQTLLRKTVQSQLGELTIESVAGTETGATKLTVTPALGEGNSYKIKMAANPTKPQFGQVCTSGYTNWDGTSDIDGINGNKIVVVEVDKDNKALKCGTATIAVKAE